jgi:hypothetical protein
MVHSDLLDKAKIYHSGPQNLFRFGGSFVEYTADKIAELLGS